MNRDLSRGMIPWGEQRELAWIGYGQKNADEQVVFEFYRQLIAVRQEFLKGNFQMGEIRLDTDVLSYQVGNLRVLLNFGQNEVQIPRKEKNVLSRNLDKEKLGAGGIYIGKVENV